MRTCTSKICYRADSLPVPRAFCVPNVCSTRILSFKIVVMKLKEGGDYSSTPLCPSVRSPFARLFSTPAVGIGLIVVDVAVTAAIYHTPARPLHNIRFTTSLTLVQVCDTPGYGAKYDNRKVPSRCSRMQRMSQEFRVIRARCLVR